MQECKNLWLQIGDGMVRDKTAQLLFQIASLIMTIRWWDGQQLSSSL